MGYGTVRGLADLDDSVCFQSAGENHSMTYVITERCIKDTSCVEFCPVDAIHPRKNQKEFETSGMLYINPSVCVDCGFCERACPVKAIFREQSVPEQYRNCVQMNADWYKIPAGDFLDKWGQTAKDGRQQV